MATHRRRQCDESGASGKIELAVGNADFALPFDKQPNETRPPIELLTTSEAGEFLRISPSSMRRLQQARRIPFFKVGGGIRFAKSDLISYLAQQRVGSLGEYR
jgi:excisionase family DNA binding protein